jgi:uncharacterized membrane protein YcaP (DUF421 family)
VEGKLVLRDAALIALSTFVIYLFLFVMLRLFGRRQTAQLSIVDLVVVVTLGSAVETSMIRANTSLRAGLVSAATLLATNFALTRLFRRSKRLRHWLGGGPLLLVSNGQVLERHLMRAGLTRDDLAEALRGHEADHVDAVRFCVLEADGSVSVVAKPDPDEDPST